MSSKRAKAFRAELRQRQRDDWEREQRARMLAEWRALELRQARAHLCGLLAGREARPELWLVPSWRVALAGGASGMERISKERPPWYRDTKSQAWQYIVKGRGFALEVVVYWKAEAASWWVAAAGRHERRFATEDGIEVHCWLTGGACEYVGLPMEVLEAFETYGEPRSSGTERPEAFWQALERVAEGKPACL